MLKSLSQSHHSQLFTVETLFHSTSNGEYFATTQITLVVLIAVLPWSAVSSSIDPLIKQIYGILCGSLLRNIQRIRNISETKPKKDLQNILENLMSASAATLEHLPHCPPPLHELSWIEWKGQGEDSERLMDHLAYTQSSF
jgi:hypothetical protein